MINPSFTPYYHCASRCVRRAFLCGKDAAFGYDFERRRAWLENRLQALADVFSIDLCAYAVMSNHYHIVLHINAAQQQGWGENEVVERCERIHRIPDWFKTADEQRIAELINWMMHRCSSAWPTSISTPSAPGWHRPRSNLITPRSRPRIEDREHALAPFDADHGNHASVTFSLPISKPDYLRLVDYTGRHLRPCKRGRTPAGDRRALVEGHNP